MARWSAPGRCGQIAAAASVPAATIASCVSTMVSSTSSSTACTPSRTVARVGGITSGLLSRIEAEEGPGGDDTLDDDVTRQARGVPRRPVETHVLQRLPRVLEHRTVGVVVAEGA